jgi:glycosyltransferase involved in cell wall biosynthesis
MNRRVCFVGSEITPSEGSTFIGGHVNTVVGLCKGLHDLGWEIHVVTTPSRFLKEASFDFPWAEFHLVHAGGKHNSPAYIADLLIKSVKTVKALSKKHGFDLVHAHSGYFGPAIIPIIVKRSVGLPALFSLYCPASLLPSKLPMDNYGVRLLSISLDRIIAVTTNVKNSLIECGVDAGKIELVPSCYDEKAFSRRAVDLAITKKLLEASVQKVLFVGNVDKTKGLDVFLAAAKSVLRINPKVKFIITLHEPVEHLESARVLVSRSLGSSGEVLGVVSDMAQLMASVDMVVAPFRSTEGISDIPLIVLEAMALGKPVVVTDLAGVRDAIFDGENGLIVEVDNPNELANTIINLLNNPSLREEIGNNAILCAKHFSYSEISKILSDLYIRTLERCN